MYSYKDCFYVNDKPIRYLFTFGSRLIVGTYEGISEIRDIEDSYKIILRITNQQKPFTCLACDEQYLYIGRPEGAIEIWNIDKIKFETSLKSQISSPTAIHFTDDFIIVDGNEKIEIIEKKTDKFLGFLLNSQEKPDFRSIRIATSENLIAVQISLEKIVFWNLPDLKIAFQFEKEEWISSILLCRNSLLVGINACMELDEICTCNIWDLSTFKFVTQLGSPKGYSIFDMKLDHNSGENKLYIIATTINTIDIWEWKTWDHVSSITDLVDTNSSLLKNDKLFIGDIYGRVSVWQKT